MLTKDFLRLVLTEKKRLLHMNDVRRINVPKYDELSVKNLFPKFKDDAAVMSFMPDQMPKGKTIDREYFFNCLNTVKPDYVRDLITHANKLRFGGGQKDNEMDEVKCSDRWWNELNSMPFISRKYFGVVDKTVFYRAQGQDHPPAEGKCKAGLCEPQEKAVRGLRPG